ncbi:MAG: sulfotransferase domain-containing protein, partial [Synechococcaceae cyanobacterium SM2_3_1]|nr:sulfotransferase domain-containing protein [Synechococcaceae cyanobacterium SM2_3_1]
NYSYVKRSIYVDQLEIYYRYFDRDNVLILESESLFDNPRFVLSKIQDFIGVEPYDYVKSTFKPHNPGSYQNKLQLNTRLQLEKLFEEYNRMLINMTGHEFSWISK